MFLIAGVENHFKILDLRPFFARTFSLYIRKGYIAQKRRVYSRSLLFLARGARLRYSLPIVLQLKLIFFGAGCAFALLATNSVVT